MPSTTGKPGGKIVGQSMSDFPIEDGVFLKALDQMAHKLKFPFISVEGELRYSQMSTVQISGTASVSDTEEPAPPKKNKVKYTCSDCQSNVWGKPEMNIVCGNCDQRFDEMS